LAIGESFLRLVAGANGIFPQIERAQYNSDANPGAIQRQVRFFCCRINSTNRAKR